MTWDNVMFAASSEHNYVRDFRNTVTPMWRRDDGGLYPLGSIIAQDARPIRAVAEGAVNEVEQRLADFLHDEDHGETLTHHEKVCTRLEGDCGRRDEYERQARRALVVLLGEEL